MIGPSQISLPDYFFGDSDYLELSARYVFTSGFTKLENKILLESSISSGPCDLGVHLHISNKIYGTPLEKVYVKISVLNKGESGWLETKKQDLRNQFDFGNYENNNVTEWIFQFKNHKELIKNYIPENIIDPLNKEVLAGFICGFADAVLNDIQFVANITILSKTNRASIPDWYYNYYMVQCILGSKEDAYVDLAFRTYITEVINSNDVISFGNDFMDVKQALTIFYELFKETLNDKWNQIYWKSGTFESGYAAGETVYVALGLKTLVIDGGKAMIALSKGAHQSMLNVAQSLKGSLTKEKIIATLQGSNVIFILDDVYKAQLATICGLMKYVDSKNVENFSQICKYEYKKNEKGILREL